MLKRFWCDSGKHWVVINTDHMIGAEVAPPGISDEQFSHVVCYSQKVNLEFYTNQKPIDVARELCNEESR